MKYAKRLALIAPEALAGTKLAINRGADAAGFRNAIRAGLDVVAPLYAGADGFRHEVPGDQGEGGAGRRAQVAGRPVR